MRKISTLFRRNPDDLRHVLAEVTPGCEWVLNGEGTATRKYDGTCLLHAGDGKWWARREVKPGKTPPPGFQPVEHDETTGKTFGWEPVEQSSFAKVFENCWERPYARGTYELIGPKVNGNPERVRSHQLIAHADAEVMPVSRLTAVVEFDHAKGETMAEYRLSSFRSLLLHLADHDGWEGIVWRHPDGRMAKLKARDFR